LGRYVRYRQEAVVRWLDENERDGAAWRQYQPRLQPLKPTDGKLR
jgi:hypothetical protein